jgi:tRNA pseudouridine38-40 synthase
LTSVSRPHERDFFLLKKFMRNIKLVLEYDGTDFVGWQFQPNGRSVQGEVERVLQIILQHQTSTFAAGRTDAGVHARGQVINFHTESSLEVESMVKSLHGLLPPDIVVRHGELVDKEFHARYSAKERRYRYTISLKPTALSRRYSWHVGYQLSES